MSDYSVQANWSEKDALPSGDANKRVRASEHATEYAAIATAIASKADQSEVDTKASTATVSSLTSSVIDLQSRSLYKNTQNTLTTGSGLTFMDGVKARFGTSGDGLEIYHDGINSILKDSGTGILKYESDVSTAFGTVFEIKNTSQSTNAGAYIAFQTDETVGAPVGLGSSSVGSLTVRIGNNEAHSFDSSSLNLKKAGTTETAKIVVGSGAPNNVVGAPVGSLYLRTDGGTDSSLYVKETGSDGNTGWVAK